MCNHLEKIKLNLYIVSCTKRKKSKSVKMQMSKMNLKT